MARPRNTNRDDEIRKLAAEGKRQTELAALYGISQPRVCQIVNRTKPAPKRPKS